MLAFVWGKTLAPVVAAMIVAHHDLGRRIALAPTRAVHAMAIFTHHALSEGLVASEIGTIIKESDLRDLLGRGIPRPHPRLFRVLNRIGPQAMRLGFYMRLNAALHGDAAATLLSSDRIDNDLLSALERVAADKVMMAAWKTISVSENDARLLSRTLAFLRATGLAADIEALPSGAGWQAIARRVEADLGRAQSPVPPFQMPIGWQRVDSLAGLWRVGKALENCVADLRGCDPDRLGQFVLGQMVFLVRDTAPTILAAIQMVAPRLWVIEQMAGKDNCPPDPTIRADFHLELAACLAEAGHKLLEDDPFRATISIAWRARDGALGGALHGMFRAA